MHICGAAAPVSEDKYRRPYGAVVADLVIAPLVDGIERIEHAPYASRERELAPVFLVDLLAADGPREGVAVGTDKGVHGEVVEIE